MSDIIGTLNKALQEAQELNDQVHGTSPILAQIAKREADVQAVAQTLATRLTDIENREAAANEREAKIAEREAALETQKQALKDLQKQLLDDSKKASK